MQCEDKVRDKMPLDGNVDQTTMTKLQGKKEKQKIEIKNKNERK